LEFIGGSREDFEGSSPYNFSSGVNTTETIGIIGEFLEVTIDPLGAIGDCWRRVWEGGLREEIEKKQLQKGLVS